MLRSYARDYILFLYAFMVAFCALWAILYSPPFLQWGFATDPLFYVLIVIAAIAVLAYGYNQGQPRVRAWLEKGYAQFLVAAFVLLTTGFALTFGFVGSVLTWSLMFAMFLLGGRLRHGTWSSLL